MASYVEVRITCLELITVMVNPEEDPLLAPTSQASDIEELAFLMGFIPVMLVLLKHFLSLIDLKKDRFSS